MKKIILSVLMGATGMLHAQTGEINETSNEFSTLTLRFVNFETVPDSLTLSVSESYDTLSFDLYNGPYVERLPIKMRSNGYYTIWLTGGSINKGVFFECGPVPYDLDIQIDVSNRDVITFSYDPDFDDYSWGTLDYDEMMAGFGEEEETESVPKE